MIKTVAVVSVLAAASFAQADVLFDSTSPFETSSMRTVSGNALGMTILVPEVVPNQDRLNEHYKFELTGAGDLSFVLGNTPGSEATFALYANDQRYIVGGKGYWGPGLQLAGTAFTFDTYAAGQAGHVSTTDFVAFGTLDSPIVYQDNNWAGISAMVTSDAGVTLPLSQLSGAGYNTIAPGFDIARDYWIGTSVSTNNLTLGTIEGFKPFSFSVDGTAQIVPEASTIQLALMGLAAIGGFAGLRRFKRN